MMIFMSHWCGNSSASRRSSLLRSLALTSASASRPDRTLSAAVDALMSATSRAFSSRAASGPCPASSACHTRVSCHEPCVP
jgi:hypothetical protein